MRLRSRRHGGIADGRRERTSCARKSASPRLEPREALTADDGGRPGPVFPASSTRTCTRDPGDTHKEDFTHATRRRRGRHDDPRHAERRAAGTDVTTRRRA
jgi:hypothetical protein